MKTRMHKILNVEANEFFTIEGLEEKHFLDACGQMMFVGKGGEHYSAGPVSYHRAIIHGVTKKIKYTKEALQKLEALHVLGYKYLVMNSGGPEWAYTTAPEKLVHAYAWYQEEGAKVPLISPTGLTSWCDTEPLNIQSAIKDAEKVL